MAAIKRFFSSVTMNQTSYDIMETLGSSLIQHGPNSSRVYLMKMSEKDYPNIATNILNIAQQNKYGKCFAKIPSTYYKAFADLGFEVEAKIPKFYSDNADALFIGKFIDPKRQIVEPERAKLIDDIRILANNKFFDKFQPASLPEGFKLFFAEEKDCKEISEVYKAVFKSYPFPIFDHNYIAETMKTFIRYLIVKDTNNKICSVASAEIDHSSQSCEMTDFATLPTHRKYKMGQTLLHNLDIAMKNDMRIAYTISRAQSPAINILFTKNGYKYGGTLTNNTDIAGSIESMNIWYKHL